MRIEGSSGFSDSPPNVLSSQKVHSSGISNQHHHKNNHQDPYQSVPDLSSSSSSASSSSSEHARFFKRFQSTMNFLQTSNMRNTSPWTKSLGCLLFGCSFVLLVSISPSSGLDSATPASSSWSTSSGRPHGLIYSSDEDEISELTVPTEDPKQQPSGSGSDDSNPQTKTSKDRILEAAPILGYYEDSNGELSNWMAGINDNTLITNLSIPGTHDSATWNYTKATQDSLVPITGNLPPAIAFQCQNRNLFQMLSDGIRFFDLRVGFLPGHNQLGFFHAVALLSDKATLADVLLGFYRWLDDHPTETVIISIKVDNGTFDEPSSKKQPSSVELQRTIYELLTENGIPKSHWLRKDSELGSMGEARGKIIFIQRFEWDLIRKNPLAEPIGIPLPPSVFKDNDPSFSITYNNQTGARAYIEDFYDIRPNPSSLQDKVDRKIGAVEKNLDKSLKRDFDTKDQFFITFASGEAVYNNPPIPPKILAQGINGTIDGVNKRLLSYLNDEDDGDEDDGVDDNHELEPKKVLGIVILDWYYETPELLKKIISFNF